MKTAIMQPYFFPYIGYFQLVNAVDIFIVYDNIKYTKKGWINRNRFLCNRTDAIFSIPLKKGSDSLAIRDREIANEFNKNKLLNQFSGAYKSSPYFEQAFIIIEKIIQYDEINLFQYIYNSIIEICRYLKINSEIIISSSIEQEPSLKKQDRVIALCQQVGANRYINAIGGQSLYKKKEFNQNGIDLYFIKSQPITYKQFSNEFVPWLSIIDVMMFNSVDLIRAYLDRYNLIEGVE